MATYLYRLGDRAFRTAGSRDDVGRRIHRVILSRLPSLDHQRQFSVPGTESRKRKTCSRTLPRCRRRLRPVVFVAPDGETERPTKQGRDRGVEGLAAKAADVEAVIDPITAM